MGVLLLSARAVRAPCSPDQVPAASRVVAGFEKPLQYARGEKLAEFLVDQLSTWAGQIGQADLQVAHESPLLLGASERVAADRRASAIREKRTAPKIALADRLEQAPPDAGAFSAEREARRSGRPDDFLRPRLTQARTGRDAGGENAREPNPGDPRRRAPPRCGGARRGDLVRQGQA